MTEKNLEVNRTKLPYRATMVIHFEKWNSSGTVDKFL